MVSVLRKDLREPVPERDRDQSVEHVLRRVLSSEGSVPQGACLDGETVAAWTTGSLRPDELSAVERHVADCARCQALVAVFVRTTPAPPAPESLWNRWRLAWIVPVATAATAAALWVALPGSGPIPFESQRKVAAPPSEELRAAAPPAAAPVAPVPSAPSESTQPPSVRLQESARIPASNEILERADADLRERPTAADERTGFAPSIAARSEAAADQQAPAAAPPAKEVDADRRQVARNAAPRAFGARQAASPLEIVAPGGSGRWRITNGQRVEWSASNTSEWTPASIGEGTFAAGSAPSAAVCWIVGRGGAVHLTTNGTRFVRIAFPEMVDLVAITATDDRNATVTAADGRAWMTSDQGRTWMTR
jgi:hypothetical protein